MYVITGATSRTGSVVAKAVYVMLQPNYVTTSNDFRAFQDKIMEAIIPALKEAKVKYVVSLSSWGADQQKGTGSVAGLHQLEQPGLTYVQDSKEKTRLDFLDLNISEHIIQLILEVADAMNAGHIQMLGARTPENTTPTSYKSFVNETLLPLYRQRKSNR